MDGGERLRGGLERGDAVVAGVMSGTSGDGIDVALVRPRFARDAGEWRLAAAEVVAFETVPFDDASAGLGGEVRGWLAAAGEDGPRRALGDVARFDAELGRAFGRAARYVAEKAGVRLDLVGSHGQTLWHHTGAGERATLQLGDGCFVARAAGAACVSDFRQADVAAGGEGAPIASHVEAWLLGGAFGLAPGSRAGSEPGGRILDPAPSAWVLNLGGMANVALLERGAVVASFDTGPAGALLDGLARRVLDAERDEGGRAALAGFDRSWGRDGAPKGSARRERHGLERSFEELVDLEVRGASLRAFAAAPAPKSCGRERFGDVYADAVVVHAGVRGWSPEELLAAAVEAVAWSVAAGVEGALGVVGGAWGVWPLFVAGGGVHNRALMAALHRHLVEGAARPVMSLGAHHDDPAVAPPSPLVREVAPSSALGVPPDAREALAFALLACAHVLEQPLPLGVGSRSTTGAVGRVVLGKRSLG